MARTASPVLRPTASGAIIIERVLSPIALDIYLLEFAWDNGGFMRTFVKDDQGPHAWRNLGSGGGFAGGGADCGARLG